MTTEQWQGMKIKLDALRDKAIKWLNWVALTIAGVDFSGVLSSLPQIQPFLPPNLYQKALAVAGIASFISHNFLKHRAP